ncbi:hypothetical protein AAMO2058_001740300 [Amorphochlora amoebiformis]
MGMTTDLNGEAVPPPNPFKRRESSFIPSITRLVSLAAAIGHVSCIPLSARDTPSPFRPDAPLGSAGVHRTIITLPEIPLELVRATKAKAEVSVNDVLMAAFSGAMKRYLDIIDQKSSFTSPQRHMRALVPVAFPRKTLSPEQAFTHE